MARITMANWSKFRAELEKEAREAATEHLGYYLPRYANGFSPVDAELWRAEFNRQFSFACANALSDPALRAMMSQNVVEEIRHADDVAVRLQFEHENEAARLRREAKLYAGVA